MGSLPVPGAPRAPRKYRIRPIYSAPDLAHAVVFATVATSREPVALGELSRCIVAGVTPDQVAAAIASLEASGMIAAVTRTVGMRQEDGRIRTFELKSYMLGPKGVAHA